MVAEGTSALVTAFPGGDGATGARRLLDLLVSLADEGCTWRGSQGDLAAHLKVQPRTVARYVALLRSRGFITTNGAAGAELEYVVLSRPRSEQAPPTPIRSGVIASITPSIMGTPDRQIPLARAVPQSSSSSGLGQSDQAPQPIRGSDQGSGGSGDGGGLDGPRELTARGEILARFQAQPTEHAVRTWAGLSAYGREIAAAKLRRWPSTKDPLHPPPALLSKVFDTAAELEQARDLARLLPDAGEPEAVPVSAPSPRRAKSEPVRSRAPWWRPLVLPAVALGLGYLIARGGGTR